MLCEFILISVSSISMECIVLNSEKFKKFCREQEVNKFGDRDMSEES